MKTPWRIQGTVIKVSKRLQNHAYMFCAGSMVSDSCKGSTRWTLLHHDTAQVYIPGTNWHLQDATQVAIPLVLLAKH